MKIFHADVSTFRQPRRIGMKNESSIKNTVKVIEEHMMHNSISHRGFADDTVFGITNRERRISAMQVRF